MGKREAFDGKAASVLCEHLATVHDGLHVARAAIDDARMKLSREELVELQRAVLLVAREASDVGLCVVSLIERASR